MKKRYLLFPVLAGLMLTGCSDYSFFETPDAPIPDRGEDIAKTLDVHEMKRALRNEIEAADACLDLNSPFTLTYDSTILRNSSYENKINIDEKEKISFVDFESKKIQHSNITINDSVIHEESKFDYSKESKEIVDKDENTKKSSVYKLIMSNIRNEGLNENNKLVITSLYDANEEILNLPENQNPITSKYQNKLYFLDKTNDKLDSFKYKFSYSWEKFTRLSFASLKEPFLAIDEHNANSYFKLMRNVKENSSTYQVAYEISERAYDENYRRFKITTKGNYVLKFVDNLLYDLTIEEVNTQVYEDKTKYSTSLNEHYVFSEYKDNDYKLEINDFNQTDNYDDVKTLLESYVPPINDYVPKDKIKNVQKPSLNHFKDINYDTENNIKKDEFSNSINQKSSKIQSKIAKPYVLNNKEYNEIGNYSYDNYGAKISSTETINLKESHSFLDDNSFDFIFKETKKECIGAEGTYDFINHFKEESKNITYRETKEKDDNIKSINETKVILKEFDQSEKTNESIYTKNGILNHNKNIFIGDDVTALEFYEGHMNHNSTNLKLRSFEILKHSPESQHTLINDIKIFKKQNISCFSNLFSYEAFDKLNLTSYLENYNYQLIFNNDDLISVNRIEYVLSFENRKLIYSKINFQQLKFIDYYNSEITEKFGNNFEATHKYLSNLPNIKYNLPFKFD